MNYTNIIAFDVSSLSTGVCVKYNAEIYFYTVSNDKDSDFNDRVYRLYAFADIMIQRYPNLNCAVMEASGGMKNAKVALQLAECRGAVKAGLHPLPILELHPSSWRKLVYGKGNMKRSVAKETAIKYAEDKGYKVENDDQAESFGLVCALDMLQANGVIEI